MSEINLSDMELFRLHDLSISSLYGIPDQGSPVAYKSLAARQLAEKFGNGHRITTLGMETLKINKHRLFGRKTRVKKRKFDEDSDFSD